MITSIEPGGQARGHEVQLKYYWPLKRIRGTEDV